VTALFQAEDDFFGHDEPAPHRSRSNVRDYSEWPHGIDLSINTTIGTISESKASVPAIYHL